MTAICWSPPLCFADKLMFAFFCFRHFWFVEERRKYSRLSGVIGWATHRSPHGIFKGGGLSSTCFHFAAAKVLELSAVCWAFGDTRFKWSRFYTVTGLNGCIRKSRHFSVFGCSVVCTPASVPVSGRFFPPVTILRKNCLLNNAFYLLCKTCVINENVSHT